ncbi:MAG: hypothetical protein R3F56_13945 [Planctomycetota bacterium]
MRFLSCSAVLAISVFSGSPNSVAAQLPIPTATKTPALPADFVVPIHSQPADPVFGEYGTWAGGRSYKVRFGEVVTFFPRLGARAPRNLPLAWRTLSVRVGASDLAATGGPVRTRVAGPHRFEYERGDVVEAYDVRPDGLEQTFVLAAPPAAAGDFVVEGELQTELRAQPVVAQHGDLVFADALGQPVLSYGRAFVLDAGGRKQAIATEFDGQRVRLRVPHAFLRDATYPVTIDPLTQSMFLNLDGYRNADVGAQAESSGQTQMVAWSLYTSTTDIDTIVYTYAPNWTTSAQVFADLSDSWHSDHPSVAYSGAADRWVVAFERQNTVSQIRLYLHARDNTGFNTGSMVFLPRMTSTSHDWKASVGTQVSSSSALALVVCQSEFGAQFDPNGVSDVFGRLVDVATGAMASAALPLAGAVSSSLDREGATVTRGTHGSFYWQTAWSQRSLAGKFELETAQVDNDGTVRPAVRIDDPTQDFHKVLARVDGADGEFLVSYVLADQVGQGYGRTLMATRFRNTYPQIVDVRHRALFVAQGTETVVNSSLAFDRGTGSHWAAAFHTASQVGNPHYALVARVGYEAGVTELQQLTSSTNLSWRPVVAHSGTARGFLVVNSEFNALSGRDFYYPLSAGTSIVGPGCGGATISARNPYAGNHNFYVYLAGAPAGQPATLLLSLAAGSTPLDFLGMAGCVLHLAPASLLTLPPTTTTIFGINAHLPLPDTFFGELYAQWWHGDPAAAGGARVSPGLQVRVR